MVKFLCALSLFWKIPQTEADIKYVHSANKKQIVNIEINFELLEQQYAECDKCLQKIQMYSKRWDARPKQTVSLKLLQDTRQRMFDDMLNDTNKNKHCSLCPTQNSSICDHYQTHNMIPYVRLKQIPFSLLEHSKTTKFDVYARTKIVSRLTKHTYHVKKEANGYTQQQNYDFAIRKMCAIGNIWKKPERTMTMKCTKLNVQHDNQQCGLEILCRDLDAVKLVENNIIFSNQQQTNPVDAFVCLVPGGFIINQID
jgi:hypothetical protein